MMGWLGLIGLLAVYSSTARIGSATPAMYLTKQLVFLTAGFVVCYAISRMPLAFFSRVSKFIFWSVTLLWWIMQIWAWQRGVSSPRTVSVPFLGSFQPSEFAKVAAMMYVAGALATGQGEVKKIKWVVLKIILPLACIGLPIFLSNFSTLAIIISASMLLMWLGSVRLRHLALITLAAVALLRLGMLVAGAAVQHNDTMRRYKEKPSAFWLKTEWAVKRTRLATMDSRWSKFKKRLSEGSSADKSARSKPKDFEQIDYARLAIASSSILPTRGPGNSEVKYMLPEAFSDFIFAIIVEEYGLLLSVVFVLLIFFVMLPWRIGVWAKKSPNLFATFLIIGMGLQITLQTLAHVGVSVELLPVTGQNLPLISHGGSSIISTCIMFGLIMCAINYIASRTAKPAPAADDTP